MLAQRVWPDRIRPLRRIEYESLVERGLLDDTRVELLLGALVEMSPQGPRHAEIVARLNERFRALPPTVRVRVQSPLVVSDDSVPEPDLAVVPAGDYSAAHPDRAMLVVEVADTSLLKDRGIKASLYASAGISEFWLVDLTARTIEVHRQPSAGRYGEVSRIDVAGSVAVEACPEVTVTVADLLA